MKHYQGYLIDLDGTIYKGKDKIEAGARFVHRLQAAGLPHLFLTNNTTRTPQAIVDMLKTFDIETDTSHIYTAAMATLDYMDELGRGDKAYVIGEVGLKTAIHAKYRREWENPDYVVVGLDTDLTYDKLAQATLAIQKGATFIGTNPDLNIPTERGLMPGAGAINHLLEQATRVPATFIGKPTPIIMDKAIELLGLDKTQVIMVGDNYLTDIRAGIDNGIDSLLVTTGFTAPDEVAGLDPQPTYVRQSLDEWEIN